MLNKIETIKSLKNVQIVQPLIEWENAIKNICKIDYPVYKLIDFSELNVYYINKLFDFTDNTEIILPYFEGSCYWVKAILNNKFNFIEYLLDNKCLNGFFLICLSNNKLYDFEIGEEFYELRIFQM